MFEIDTLAGLIDQDIRDPGCILITVKADEIIRLFVFRVRGAVKGRMTSNGEIQGFRIGRVSDLPLHSHRAPLQAMCDGQLKSKGIFRTALLIVTEAESDRILSLVNKGKVHIAGKSVLSHRVTLPFVTIDTFVHLTHKRKEHRCMPVPVGRIRLPHDFVLLNLVINTAQLRPVRRDRDLQELILDHMHFTSHGFPPSLYSG